MAADVDVVVVHVALVAEKRVGLRYLVRREERSEALQLDLLPGQRSWAETSPQSTSWLSLP